MREIVSTLASDPLLLAAALASFVGLFLYWSYGGFINENHTQVKWFRRLFLPHVTKLLHEIDKKNDKIDLRGVYVESQTRESEHVFDLYLKENSFGYLVPYSEVSKVLKDNHFRPEVILSSLGTSPNGKRK